MTPLRAQRPAGNRRRVPGVPRRRRPRPERPVAADGEAAAEGPSAPRGRPRGGQQEEAVGTLERYSHKNDDGSFTFGYVGADGSFREETRGVDCITRGKYGYIDPDGVKREYSYTSGLPCEIGEDGQQLQNVGDNNEINVVDTVDPRERFRQTQNVQLAENEIPEAAKRQRVRTQINRRPAVEAAEAPEQPAAAPVQQQPSAFTNFGNFNAANSNPSRGQIPTRRPVPTRNGGDALTNLLNIADESVPAQAAPAIPQRIQPAAPAIPQRVPAGSFDFDSELEGFTLNRPSLTFEQNRNNGEQPSTSFQSQLVFNQQTGTFQTQLQQNIPGSESINLQNAAAPFAVASTTTPAPASIADNDFTLTTRVASPTPTIGTPAPASRPTQASNAGVVPAGTFKLDFEPLNIPAAAPQAPTRAPVATTFPTQPATVRVPAPTPAAPQPAPARPQPGQNTFFVFQPFNQGGQPAPSPRPASDPFNTPLNQNAFRIVAGAQGAAAQRPVPQAASAGVPQPQQFFQPQQLQPQAGAPAGVPQPQQFFQPQQVQQQAGAPAPISLPIQRLPVPQAAAPQRPAAPPAFQPQAAAPTPQAAAPAPQASGAPQLQFGFQPVIRPQQGQPQGAPQLGQPQPPRNVPFTAFRTGTPPQLQVNIFHLKCC